MKSVFTVFLLLFLFSAVSGQNLIGYSYNEIRGYMKENRKEMAFNKVTNSKFNYLKYSDSSENQTVLFFLDNDSICRSVRIICDQVSKSQRIKEFDSIYRKKGENRWIDTRKGMNYTIDLRDETWASVITILPLQ